MLCQRLCSGPFTSIGAEAGEYGCTPAESLARSFSTMLPQSIFILYQLEEASQYTVAYITP